MVVIKWFLKLITALILSILFAVFCLVILGNAVVTNVIFNTGYYESLIHQTEFVEEVRIRVFNQKTNQFLENYQGDLEIEMVEEIIFESLMITFPNYWFKDCMNLFAIDIVEFGLFNNEKFFSKVEIKEEKINYRKNVAKQIEQKIENLSTSEIVVLTDQVEAASEFPNQILFEELLQDHFDPVIIGHIISFPEQRETVILSIYFLSGIFALLFYFLIGMSSGLRWAGFTMMATSGAFIYARFEYLEVFLGDILVKLQISKVFASYLLEKSSLFILKVPIIFAIVGLILFIIGILTEPKKKKEEIKEDLKEEMIEIEE